MSQASASFQNVGRARRLKDSFWLFEPGAGIKHVLERLGPPIESWWRDLAVTSITPKVIEKLREGMNAELKPLDLTDPRDDVPLSLLEFKGHEQPIALGSC